MSKKLTK